MPTRRLVRLAAIMIGLMAVGLAIWIALRPGLDWAGRRRLLLQVQSGAASPANLPDVSLQLLATLVAPVGGRGPALWQSWCSIYDLAACSCASSDPLNCSRILPNQPQNNVPLEVNLLSAAALGIRSTTTPPGPPVHLQLRTSRQVNPVIAAHYLSRPHGSTTFTEWPDGSIAVKAIWARFLRSEDCIVLPVWSRFSFPLTETLLFESWPEKVAVVRNLSARRRRDCDGHSNLEEVALTEFYNRPARWGGLFHIDPPPQEVNSDVFLVGIHFTTAEVPNWLWITAWWSRRASALPHPWSNYRIASDISKPVPAPTGNPMLSGAPLANPYLEIVAPYEPGGHGANTDCISCHSAAALGAEKFKSPGLRVPQKDSYYRIWSAEFFPVLAPP